MLLSSVARYSFSKSTTSEFFTDANLAGAGVYLRHSSWIDHGGSIVCDSVLYQQGYNAVSARENSSPLKQGAATRSNLDSLKVVHQMSAIFSPCQRCSLLQIPGIFPRMNAFHKSIEFSLFYRWVNIEVVFTWIVDQYSRMTHGVQCRPQVHG